MSAIKQRAQTTALSPAAQLLEFAQATAKTSTTWMQLHNAVYGLGGKFGELFPDQKSRVVFAKSPEFREIASLIGSLKGDDAEDAVLPSGKFLLRLPESMHAALLAEAKAEGVSLNQLCLAKLAAQLQAVVR